MRHASIEEVVDHEIDQIGPAIKALTALLLAFFLFTAATSDAIRGGYHPIRKITPILTGKV